jgi:hypothetical protein
MPRETYNKNKHKYAVVQQNWGLYGVGETEDAAIRDSIEWIEKAESIDDVKALIEDSAGYNCPFVVINDPKEIKSYMDNV